MAKRLAADGAVAFWRIVWLSIGKMITTLSASFAICWQDWSRRSGIKETPLGLLLGAVMSERDAILAAFINAAAETPDSLAPRVR